MTEADKKDFQRIINIVNYIDEIKRLNYLEEYNLGNLNDDEEGNFWSLIWKLGDEACYFADAKPLIDALKERLSIDGIILDEDGECYSNPTESMIVGLQEFLEQQLKDCLEENEETREKYLKKKAAKEKEEIKRILTEYLNKLDDSDSITKPVKEYKPLVVEVSGNGEINIK